MIEPVIDAYTKSWRRMTQLLFNPFQVPTYLMFALAFFLSDCGSLGGSTGNNVDLSDLPSPGTLDGQTVAIIVGIGLLVVVMLLVGAVMWAGVLFLSSRATVVAIDGLQQGLPRLEAHVQYAVAANALWRFRVGVMVAGLAWLVMVVGGSVTAALVLGESGSSPVLLDFGRLALSLMVLFAVLPPALLTVVLDWFAKDLAAPILMATEGQSVVGAFRALWGAARFDPSALFVYVVLRIGLAIVVAMVSFPFLLMFCCIFMIPGVRQAVFLPLLMFQRGLSLYWLATLDDRFASLAPVEGPV